MKLLQTYKKKEIPTRHHVVTFDTFTGKRLMIGTNHTTIMKVFLRTAIIDIASWEPVQKNEWIANLV